MGIFSDETVREKLRDFEDLLTTSSKRVIEMGGDINSLDEDGETVFFKVCGSVDSLNCRRFIPLLNLLLDLGADTDISPPHQSSKMHPIFRPSDFPEIMNCREDFEKLYVRIFNAGTSIDSLVDEKRWYIWTSLLEDNYLARLLLESGLNAEQSGCAFYHCVAAYRNWHLHNVAANRKWHLISSVETEKKLFELIDLSMSKKIDMNYLHGEKSFLRFGIEVKELRCLFAKHLFSESFSIAPIHNKGVFFLNLIDCFRRESSSVTAKWLTRYTTEIVDLFGYDRVFKSREIFERSDLRAFAKCLFQNKNIAVWLLDMYRRYTPPLGRSHDEELLFKPLNLAVGYGVLELIDLLYDNGLELDCCQDAFLECFNRKLNGGLRGYRFRINRLDVMKRLFQRGVDNESNDLFTIAVSRFRPRGPSRVLNNSCLCLPVFFLTNRFSISNARAQMWKLSRNVEKRWRIKQELKLTEIVETLLNLGCPFNSEPDQIYLTRKNHLCVLMVPVGYGRSVLCQLFKAGAGLAYLHNIAQAALAVPRRFAYREPISPLKSQLYICQAAVLAGFAISDQDLQDIRYLNFDKDQIEWFSRMRESPLSLMCQCRSAIRRELSLRSTNRTILPHINGLPLPDTLRMYIRYEGSACEIDLETDYY